MKLAIKFVLFSWIMVFGGCGAEDHHHDHDHDHDHHHEGEVKDGPKHGSGQGGGQGAGKADGSGDKDGKGKETGQAPVNSKCPLNPTRDVKADVVTSFGDQNVAFCCNRCKSKFDGFADEMKSTVLAKVTK